METLLDPHLQPFVQAVLIVLVLCACITCLWMVFFFGRRLQTSAYLRESLVAAVREEERKGLARELLDRAIAGPLDPKKQPPDAFGQAGQLWERDKWIPYVDRLSDDRVIGEETPEQRETRRKQLGECRQWEGEERERYAAELQRVEKEALRRAERRIPKSMDISMLGGGWSFLLEFSTVIVIIFTLLALGVSGAIPGKDISTILAAVAGYVLGKATSATSSSGRDGGEGAKP
jgi:hypothetical protein